jgi:hypothetical protein
MRLPLTLVVFAVCLAAAADMSMSLEQLKEFVRWSK